MINELSPQLLQHASDVAYQKGRYSQSDNFQRGANEECGKLFNMQGVTASPMRLQYENGNLRCILNNNGQYYINASKTTKSSESGYIRPSDSNPVPKYMKAKDAKLARLVAKWWSMYGQVDIPALQDWHNWMDYGISFMRETTEITSEDIINEVCKAINELIFE